VLLHGGGARWQQHMPIIPTLSESWHVYAPDLRVHGKSGRVPGRYRPEHYVADIAELLEKLVVEPSVVFGHSLGGWIALLVAASRPERVRALILGDPPLNMERYLAFEGSEGRIAVWRTLRDLAAAGLDVPQLATALGSMVVGMSEDGEPVRYGDLPGIDGAHLLEWATTLGQVDADVAFYHAAGRMDEYAANVDINAALRRVVCPTLLLQADPTRGGLVSDADADRALSILDDGYRMKLVGAGHDIGGWDEEIILLRAVAGFLDTL